MEASSFIMEEHRRRPTLAELGEVVDVSDPKANVGTRKKVPSVGKGVSQMAWMRKIRSEKHAAGSIGRSCTREIGLDELKGHKDGKDAWIAVRGKVYNISPYLEYHPGGSKILEDCAGTDATKLFNKYHAWVNAEYILEACQIGKLKTV